MAITGKTKPDVGVQRSYSGCTLTSGHRCVNYSDPFGLCPDPKDPACRTGGPGTASGSAEVFKQLGEKLDGLKPILSVGPHVGVSHTAGNYSVSAEVGPDGKVSANHSLVIGAPQLGASFDVGFKTEAPEGAHTGSVDFGLGKHLGVSVNGYYTGGTHLTPNGVTFHLGGSVSACETCPSVTADLNPQH